MLLALLLSCEDPEPTAGIASITLAPQGLTLEVSPLPGLRFLGDGSAQLSFRRGAEMNIAVAPPDLAPSTYPHEAELAPMVRLAYGTERADGGMGGPEDHLDGLLTAYGRKYLVQCSSQSEHGSPDARWCLEVLKTTRPR